MAKRAKAGRGARTSSRASSRDGADELSIGTDKLYFKIGEVAEIVGVAPHVLRYWETEFAVIKPQKSRTQQRVYRRRDVATLLRIKRLLYEERFTIAGARKQLREDGNRGAMAAPSAKYVAKQSLAKVWAVVDELQALLQSEAEIDPTGADPAEYLRQAGGARTVAEDPAASSRGMLERPQRG
ncbi:MerR family transcriptional regulator [Paraliomyxa miuraensis]|uniref:MerR family transcriptional regulator n=1 Tax=Paraliomyxa miuraensis TaxID=376150 RepID=UPI0022584BC6|nr:MerR family transcriptional regulator [Paraliomyxa miuraensis]MCX4244539.1 MerR family transcriptional regulator [Paraliomyxa miuraensis]